MSHNDDEKAGQPSGLEPESVRPEGSPGGPAADLSKPYDLPVRVDQNGYVQLSEATMTELAARMMAAAMRVLRSEIQFDE